MSSSLKYYDSCPECDSLNVKVCGEINVNGVNHIELVCRECGADWADLNE